MSFKKLVRFEHNGTISYGDLLAEDGGTFTVRKLQGNVCAGFTPGDEDPVQVSQLLCPLESTPIIICIGLNYKKHAAEANLPIPKYPVIFTKPADALHGPRQPVLIPKGAQKMLDYEGELTFVVGRDVKNLPMDADYSLDEYILGYTAGNDVSARNYQVPDASGGQFCYAKSFDGFAPIGPYIVSPSAIPNIQALRYTTRVNGEVRQETGTEDMIWSVKEILRHLSQGTTVRAGTVIMTGTPAGVGYFTKRFLQDGDVVEVDIERVGRLSNTMQYE
ncbi:hypothetical protein BJX99DRAFT_268910 [Aspergillus californicus]